MPSVKVGISVESAPPSTDIWVPAQERGSKLQPSGAGLVHSYESNVITFPEADWVYLQVNYAAYQIHPAKWDELDQFGAFDGRNMQRWTWEGPTSHRPGDPGAGNCTVKLEIAYSLNDNSPGDDWVPYRASKYRLRSAKARVTITRPNTDYSFRITRFSIFAQRAAEPQVLRKIHNSVEDRVPNGMSRVVVHDFEIEAGGNLEVEAGGYLEVLT